MTQAWLLMKIHILKFFYESLCFLTKYFTDESHRTWWWEEFSQVLQHFLPTVGATKSHHQHSKVFSQTGLFSLFFLSNFSEFSISSFPWLDLSAVRMCGTTWCSTLARPVWGNISGEKYLAQGNNPFSSLVEAGSCQQTWGVSWEWWTTVTMLRGSETSSPTSQTSSAMVTFDMNLPLPSG